jgi:hypothetical membrane protein
MSAKYVQQTPAQRQTNRLLLACGVIGPVLFTLMYLIEGATRPGYNAWQQAISALSLSEQGWMQIVNFMVCGLLILGFGVGLRQTLGEGKNAKWGSLLVGAVGAGLFISGIFVTDPAQGYPPGIPAGPALPTTLHGAIHFFIGAIAVFGLLPASCWVLAQRFAHTLHWGKAGAIYSIVTGILMLAFFVAFAIAGKYHGPAGLFERISIMLGMFWIVLFATRLMNMTPWPRRGGLHEPVKKQQGRD